MLKEFILLFYKEILVTTNLQTYTQTKKKLIEHHIPYETNVKSNIDKRRGRGFITSNNFPSYYYYLYVKKKDYDQALSIISNQ